MSDTASDRGLHKVWGRYKNAEQLIQQKREDRKVTAYGPNNADFDKTKTEKYKLTACRAGIKNNQQGSYQDPWAPRL